jgi:hypothetical protein
VTVLPIENENYGMLYSFQPRYLAQLIHDEEKGSSGDAGHEDALVVLLRTVTGCVRNIFFR